MTEQSYRLGDKRLKSKRSGEAGDSEDEGFVLSQPEDKHTPSQEDSLMWLSKQLGTSSLLTQHEFVYIANISVRANRLHLLELLQPLGKLLAFDFVIRDKMFRFQAALAIFENSKEVIENLKSKPMILFKRKLRIFELSTRNNSATLLAILAKKLSSSAPSKQSGSLSDSESHQTSGATTTPRDENGPKPRKPSTAATASDQEQASESQKGAAQSTSIRTSSVKDLTQEIHLSVFGHYLSKFKGFDSKLIHNEQNLSFNRSSFQCIYRYSDGKLGCLANQAITQVNLQDPKSTNRIKKQALTDRTYRLF
jgi:hypothetical protein